MCGFFMNKLGYNMTKIPCTDPPLYDVSLTADLPLCFVTRQEVILEPNRHFVSDRRSGPNILDTIIPRDGYLLSYLMHDSGYAFGGFWIGGRFTKFSRKEVDDLIYDMLISEGAWPTTAWLVWANVRAFGASHWRKGDKRKKG
jgi:hypothetical protein